MQVAGEGGGGCGVKPQPDVTGVCQGRRSPGGVGWGVKSPSAGEGGRGERRRGRPGEVSSYSGAGRAGGRRSWHAAWPRAAGAGGPGFAAAVPSG